jgi:hypothetical protein
MDITGQAVELCVDQHGASGIPLEPQFELRSIRLFLAALHLDKLREPVPCVCNGGGRRGRDCHGLVRVGCTSTSYLVLTLYLSDQGCISIFLTLQ